MAKYFGGIQGGGTASDAVILDQSGRIVGTSTGPCTNPWQVGFAKCIADLGKMIIEAKKNANLDPSIPLESLGMALSGGEMLEAQERIADGLKTEFPNASKSYYVCTDTFGSIATAFPNGGMVVIAGTGSNCQLLNPSGKDSPRSGGWGHMLGDEGSAYWISHSALKVVYDHEDGFNQSADDIAAVKNAIYTKFDLKNKYDILPHIYEKFCKAKIADLCQDLARLAVEEKDPLAIRLFHNAGVQIGKHIRALMPKADKCLLQDQGGLKIVAVGSVMTKAWELLKEGFMETLSSGGVEFTLVMLKEDVSSALGGAVLGAKFAGLSLALDYASNTTLLFHYKPYNVL